MQSKRLLTALMFSSALAVGTAPAFGQSGSGSGTQGGQIPGTVVPAPESGSGMGSGSGVGSDRGMDHGTGAQIPGEKDLSSAQIRELQQALKAQGHDPGSTSGVMDSQTRAALRSFQQANNLATTGTLDAQTAQKLGISLKSDMPSSGSHSGESSSTPGSFGGSSHGSGSSAGKGVESPSGSGVGR